MSLFPVHVVQCRLSHVGLISLFHSAHSAGRPPKWVQNLLQKGAAESRVEPDLSGQGTAESRRAVEPAPDLTDNPMVYLCSVLSKCNVSFQNVFV